MADQAPQDRAARLWTELTFEAGTNGAAVDMIARELVKADESVREELHAVYRVKLDEAHRVRLVVEATARAKAFEEAAEVAYSKKHDESEHGDECTLCLCARLIADAIRETAKKVSP